MKLRVYVPFFRPQNMWGYALGAEIQTSVIQQVPLFLRSLSHGHRTIYPWDFHLKLISKRRDDDQTPDSGLDRTKKTHQHMDFKEISIGKVQKQRGLKITKRISRYFQSSIGKIGICWEFIRKHWESRSKRGNGVGETTENLVGIRCETRPWLAMKCASDYFCPAQFSGFTVVFPHNLQTNFTQTLIMFACYTMFHCQIPTPHSLNQHVCPLNLQTYG